MKIEKHEIGDVIWYQYKEHTAFDLDTLISCLPKEDLTQQLQFLN